jgi:hypothetical protein
MVGMNNTPAIIRFIQRTTSNPWSTWEYERVPTLLVEFLCLLAGIWAAPTQSAMWLAVVSTPLSLLATEFARADRSAAARKAEIATATGIPSVVLPCARDIEQAAKNRQLITATAPIVALAASVAGANGAGITAAAIVGFIVSVVRWAAVEIYGKWRAWYRTHVPVKIPATTISTTDLETSS